MGDTDMREGEGSGGGVSGRRGKRLRKRLAVLGGEGLHLGSARQIELPQGHVVEQDRRLLLIGGAYQGDGVSPQRSA